MGFGNVEAALVGFIFLAGVIVVSVFYLKNLQDLLRECEPENRKTPPANVWLLFIPFFNAVYPFIMYPKISESLRREFEYRNSPQRGDYLKGLGLALAITVALTIIPYQPIRKVVSLAAIIMMIIYWAKTSQIKNQLRSMPKGNGEFKTTDIPDLLD